MLLAGSAARVDRIESAFARMEREAARRRAEALREGAQAAYLGGELIEARSKLRGTLEQQDSQPARFLWGRLRRGGWRLLLLGLGHR